MNPLTKGEHKNGNRVIFDWCRTLDGCICGIRLQGSWHGKNELKYEVAQELNWKVRMNI